MTRNDLSEVLRETIARWDSLEEEWKALGKLSEIVRLLCKEDLFYLLVRVCRRTDMLNDFAFARCR